MYFYFLYCPVVMACGCRDTVSSERGCPCPIEYAFGKELFVGEGLYQCYNILMALFQFRLCFLQRCALVFLPKLDIHRRISFPIVRFGQKRFMLSAAIDFYPIQQQQMPFVEVYEYVAQVLVSPPVCLLACRSHFFAESSVLLLVAHIVD